MTKKMNNKGFSLVELIIVIAIMAILIGVLAPQFIKYVERSRESTDLQNVEECKTAIEAYVADSQGISSDVTVSVPGGSSAITITGGVGVTDLADYGITSASLNKKSTKWTAYAWVYNQSTYAWSLTNNTGADYFNSDGTGK